MTIATQTVEIGQQFDLFNNNIIQFKKTIQEFKGESFNRNDFEITKYDSSGSGNSYIPEKFLTESGVGKYSISKAGEYSFILNDKKNGIRYFAGVNVILGKNAPLKEGDITVSDNALINYNKLSQGIITVSPKNEKEFVMTNIDFFFNLPEGATIDWNSMQSNNKKITLGESFIHNVWTGLEESNVFEIPVNEKVPILFSVTEENGRQKLSIKSDYGLKLDINFNINYMDKSYTYMISFYPNHFISFMGGRTYSINLSKSDDNTRNIFEFLSGYGTDKDEIKENEQRLIDGVNSGRYILMIPGVKENDLIYPFPKKKPFTGDIHFTHPGNGQLRIYDRKLKTVINGWSFHFVINSAIDIEYNEKDKVTENLKALFDGYWKDSYKVVSTNDGIEYNTENNSIYVTSKDIKDEKIIIWDNDVLAAEIGVNSYIEENRDKHIENTISNMSKNGGDSRYINMSNDKTAIITASILKALKNSSNGKGNYLVVVLKSSSGNMVEWSFNSAVMKNIADKNIVLNVQVGAKVENTGIDKILEKTKETGLKVGFWDNGELPGETQVRLYLSDEEAAILERNTYEKTKISDEDINTIYLYYYNPSMQRLVKERSNLYINSTSNNKKYISIPVTHNSDFVLSTASDLDKNTSSSSGIILGGGTSIVYTPAPTATVAPTAIPTATPTVVPTTTPVPTSTVVPTAAPTITPEPVATPTIVPTPEPTVIPEPTVTPSVKNKVKKVKAVKKKVTVKKNKKVKVNFKVTATDNTKVVKYKVKVTVKNKKVAKVMKTKVKVGKAIVTVKGLKKGKTILKVNIGGKTAKTTLKIQ